MKSKAVPISLEFFPPKSEEGFKKLEVTRSHLYSLNPEYCSVTYGAGGSTQSGTTKLVHTIQQEGKHVAMHLSCIGSLKEEVRRLVSSDLLDYGISHILALRGDLPSGYGMGGVFHFASDLVTFLRQEYGDKLHITVAAYPETHPQAKTPVNDIEAFIQKVNAGANDAITQYFFNADAYFRFVDEIAARGVNIPIIPGIMPITNSTQLLRFSDSCGAEIPRWLRLRLMEYHDDISSITAFGTEVVTKMCERLINGGAPGLHFYSMNHSDPVIKICRALF